MISGPDGAPLVEPLSHGQEGILYADLELLTIDFSKQTIDDVGHYSRPDLLSLLVNPEAAKQVTIRPRAEVHCASFISPRIKHHGRVSEGLGMCLYE